MTLKEIFSLTRTNAQGKPALGFGVVLLVMGITIIGGLYMIHVLRLPQRKDPTVKVNTPNSQGTRRGFGSPVEQPLLLKDELPDTRQKPSKNLETLFQQNESKAETNKNGGWVPRVDPKQMPPDKTPGGGKLTTALLKPKSDEHEAKNEEKYHFVDKLLAITNQVEVVAGKKTGFQTRHFLPRGHKIPIILLSQINTSVGSMPVETAVAQDVPFNGRLQLPFGWKIYGTANQGPNHKVNVHVNTIVDPLGREYPIAGLILNTEHEPGFTGYPLESPVLLQMLPIAQTAIQTFMDAAKKVTTQQAVVPSGSGAIVASQQQYSLDAKNKLLDGTAKVIEGIMAKKAEELNKLYPEGNVVPRGTLGWIYLTGPLDMSLGEAGGSAKFLSAKDASPTPNVITLSQQQEGSKLQFPPADRVNLPPGINLPQGATPQSFSAYGTTDPSQVPPITPGAPLTAPGQSGKVKPLE